MPRLTERKRFSLPEELFRSLFKTIRTREPVKFRAPGGLNQTRDAIHRGVARRWPNYQAHVRWLPDGWLMAWVTKR